MSGRLKGKVAVVTGAETAARLRAQGGRAGHGVCDVSDRSNVTDVEKGPKNQSMGLYRASYEVFKDEGTLVLYCEQLQTVKYRNSDSAKV